jgi:quinol monooxygenase YgiN
MSCVILTVEFHARPDKTQELLEILKANIEPSRNEPGCLYYALSQSDDQENTYFLFQHWKSQDDVRSHLISSHVTQTAKDIRDCLKDSFTIRYFTDISA